MGKGKVNFEKNFFGTNFMNIFSLVLLYPLWFPCIKINKDIFHVHSFFVNINLFSKYFVIHYFLCDMYNFIIKSDDLMKILLLCVNVFRTLLFLRKLKKMIKLILPNNNILKENRMKETYVFLQCYLFNRNKTCYLIRKEKYFMNYNRKNEKFISYVFV